jgi:hypothetical protein
MWGKYLNLEFVGFCIVIALCVYFYFKHDKKKINPSSIYKQITNILKEDLEDYITIEDTQDFYPKQKNKKKTLKSENRCKEIFERLFNKEFPSVRPSFLKNPVTGHNLELDGYNEELQLAFEYNGKQHSAYVPHFHRAGPKEFIYQTKKDAYKSKICKMRGIELIQIPHYIHFDNLESYIIKNLKRIKRFSNYF